MSAARRAALRLVPVAASAWICAAAATFIPGSARWIAAAMWGTAAVAVLAAWARRRHGVPVAVVIAVLAVSAGAAAASHVVVAEPARAALADMPLDGGRAVSVTATIVGKIAPRADGSVQFDAVTTTVAYGDATRQVAAEITVRAQTDEIDGQATMDMGATIRADGIALPGRAGARAVLEVIASRGVAVVAPADGVLAATSRLRTALVAAASRLPGGGAALIPGLAVGDTALVDAELDTAMKTASLSHLTAVSGANCAIVVALAFALTALLGGGRRLRVACGLVALGAFVVLVTPEPSVVRAAAMAAIAMLALLVGRRGVGLAVLALAVTVMLVADPWLSGSMGFALSTAATAALLVAARPLADGLSRWLPRSVALALAVPLSAQLACGPLLILIEPTVPVYGVVANLLAGPAAPIATVVGVAAALAVPWPWLQDSLVAVAWVPAMWIATTAHTFATMPGGSLAWLEGAAGMTALAVLGLAVGITVVVRDDARPGARVMVIVARCTVAITIGVSVGATVLTSPAGAWALPPHWTILACDVGQGDAVLVRSARTVALIDTGPSPPALDSCLARAGIDRIDLLVLTHFDADHVGGVAAVVGRTTLVLHGPPDAAGGAVLDELEGAGAALVAAHAGQSGALGDARWRVLWPRPDTPAGNDASVVWEVAGGAVPSTLMLGDLSETPQRTLSASGTLAGHYAVIKVAHHGSADQSAELYEQTQPDVALLTVGEDNRYGHPRAEILDVLTDAGARIARTDTEGMVILSPDEGGIAIWRERGG